MKIPLFDIDGTLFKTADPIHKDAFSYAFKQVYNVNADQTEINPEGMTDNQIILEILMLHGLSEEKIKKNIKDATNIMGYYFKKHETDVNPKILPGVTELLLKLKSRKNPIGILSGNVEDIAWIKIKKAGIRNFFDFGAFGNSAFKRVDLVEIARKNAENVFQKRFKTEDFVIVGDTPKDIKCAKDAGIKVIAVTTGVYSFNKLFKEKPDLLIHNFKDKNGDNIIDFLDN